MGNVKYRYIHYEKAGGKFGGRTVTGISSLSKKFAISQVYFEMEYAPQSIGEAINSTIRLLISTQDYGDSQDTLYFLVSFLFASS